MKQYN